MWRGTTSRRRSALASAASAWLGSWSLTRTLLRVVVALIMTAVSVCACSASQAPFGGLARTTYVMSPGEWFWHDPLAPPLPDFEGIAISTGYETRVRGSVEPDETFEAPGWTQRVIRAGWPYYATECHDPPKVRHPHPGGVLWNGKSGSISIVNPTPYTGIYWHYATLPVRPIPLGILKNTVFWIVALWLPFVVVRGFRNVRRHLLGMCIACGYPVGIMPRCPECGLSNSPDPDGEIAREHADTIATESNRTQRVPE